MNILQIVSGGIAAYKAIELSSQLMKRGHNVKVILTENAKKFVTELPFQTLTKSRVYSDTFEEINEREIQHIDLGKWADKIIIAPATANIIAKMANGIADDLSSTLLLAISDFSKIYIAPAMNTNMYLNPITQKNMILLTSMGVNFIEPDSGVLACGDEGRGKFPPTEKILENLFAEDESEEKLEKISKKVLVTAGPTKEFIDPFRCLTNPSSGKMGIAIAENFAKRGADVTLITGVNYTPTYENIKVIKIVSSQDMFEAVKSNFENMDIIVKAAAVSDYTPVVTFDKKVKKQDDNLTIEFKRTADILKYVGENKKVGQVVVGFAAETHNLLGYAKEKIVKKNLDYIVANDISNSDIGFGSDDNEVYIIARNGNIEKINKANKNSIANAIINKITDNF